MTASYGGVDFEVILQGGWAAPQWTPGRMRVAEFAIAGTNRVVTQFGGADNERLTVQAEVSGSGAIDTLKALRGATLRTVSNYPAFGGDVNYTDVYLVDVQDPVWDMGRATETTDCTLVFGREVL